MSLSQPKSIAAGAQRTVATMRYGSLAILGGYSIAICYKCGVLRRVLPSAFNSKLEQMVGVIKSKTEPLGNTARFALVRRHLTKTYGLVASGMLTAAIGVAAFWLFPSVPISLSITATLVPSMLLIGIPKSMMRPAVRTLCYYIAWLSAGYTFGPIGWIAQDTLVVFVLLSGCTVVGLCVPLFLTRGMVSYIISSQVLSTALSVALMTAPKHSRANSPFKTLKEQHGVQIILNGDINVLFTLQQLSNVCILALHTLPTIYRVVSQRGETEEALQESLDPLFEAFGICAGAMYVAYRIVRWSCRRLIQIVVSDSRRSPGGGQGQNTWLVMSSYPMNVDGAIGVVSGAVMCLWYVKVVALLQKSDPASTLNHLRHFCACYSPMGLLLESTTTGR